MKFLLLIVSFYSAVLIAGPLCQFDLQSDGMMPAKLSQTGCFSQINPRQVIGGAVAFRVKAPLWTDGAHKERFVVIPKGRKAVVQKDGQWIYPKGTVTIKNFFYTSPVGQEKLVETRMLVNSSSGIRGFSYKWNSEQTEAYLLKAGERVTLTAVIDNKEQLITHDFPSTSDCSACHSSLHAGFLALSTEQLNFVDDHSEHGGHQLEKFVRLGLLDVSKNTDQLPTLASYGTKNHARSYLHVHCASCHNNKGGAGVGDFSLEWGLTLSQMGLCNAEPWADDLGLEHPRIVDTDNPEQGILWKRVVSHQKEIRMPPVGTGINNQAHLNALFEWLSDLECE